MNACSCPCLVYAISTVNNKRLMGEYVDNKTYNYISGTIITIIILTIVLVAFICQSSGIEERFTA
jgi:hypothetical protein